MVFLSFNSSDRFEAQRIFGSLTGLGVSVWMDQTGLVAGNPSSAGILDALYSARAVLVLAGPAGLGPWQQFELQHLAVRRRTDSTLRVGMVLLPPCTPGWEWQIAVSPEVCFISNNPDCSDLLANSIKEWLTNK